MLAKIAILSIVLASGVAHAETFEVKQKGRSFAPAALSIKPGDTVKFINNDDTSHSVLSETIDQAFDLKQQRPGEAKMIRFDKPGTVEVECDLHPKMHLTIVVK